MRFKKKMNSLGTSSTFFFFFFLVETMKHKPPTLKNIINNFTSLNELQEWAADNGLMNHILVQNRINHFQSINWTDVLNSFTDANSLISWATDNCLLNNSQVLDKLVILLTCTWCKKRFYLSTELRDHLEIHEILGDMTTGQNTTVNIANNTTVDHSSDISDVPSTSFSNQYTPTLESELVTPLHCPSDDLGDSFLANLLPFNSTSCPNTNGSDIENVLVGTDQHITLNMNDSEKEGYGAEPEENPYLFRRSGQKTFSKNLAKETTYKVKFNDTWKGKKLRNLKKELENMFDDV